MPWREVSFMDQRREFVGLFQQPDVNRRELCRRFGISPKTAYKWLARAGVENKDWAQDRSRRPRISPRRSTAKIETAVLEIREAHPVWGARKTALSGRPAQERPRSFDGSRNPGTARPRPFTCAAAPIHSLRASCAERRLADGLQRTLPTRRSADVSPAHDGRRPFALCSVPSACTNEQAQTVQQHLERTFRHYGLPSAFLVDNGVPWGPCSEVRWTRLRVWLLKLGVNAIYARPHHPQTKGKNERFHRTLKAEVRSMRTFRTSRELQKAFDHWRLVYNNERPHHSLGQEVPASRYRPSPPLTAEQAKRAGIRGRSDPAQSRVGQGQHQFWQQALAYARRIPRRTTGHQITQRGWRVRRLLWNPPNRMHQHATSCSMKPLPMSPNTVTHVPGPYT
jgi:transposase InsO family protein